MAYSLNIPRSDDAATAAMGVLSRRAGPSNRTYRRIECPSARFRASRAAGRRRGPSPVGGRLRQPRIPTPSGVAPVSAPACDHRSFVLRLYGGTLDRAGRLVEGVPDERWAELPHDGAKHPAWALTHLCLASGMVDAHLRGEGDELGVVPAAWAAVGMPGADLVADRSAYPAGAELLEVLGRAHAALAATYRAASDERLAAEFPVEAYRAFFPTLGDAATYVMAYHEGYHLGQVSQWRRAVGFGPIAD